MLNKFDNVYICVNIYTSNKLFEKKGMVMHKLDQLRKRYPRIIAEYEAAMAETINTSERIRMASDIGTLLLAKGMGTLDHEEFWVISLSVKNVIQNITHLYKGTLNTSAIRIAEVYRTALQHNAAAIIVAHNHPSGDTTPSADDIQVTRDLNAAGRLLDVDFLDHILVAKGDYISFRERSLIQ